MFSAPSLPLVLAENVRAFPLVDSTPAQSQEEATRSGTTERAIVVALPLLDDTSDPEPGQELNRRVPESTAAVSEAKLDPVSNGSMDLFCFNESNADEVDTSREDEALPSQFNPEARIGPASTISGRTTQHSQPTERNVDSHVDASSQRIGFISTHSNDIGDDMLMRNAGGLHAVEDIGIYAEEEIGDEWEDELEAAGAGVNMLDDSREDDEQSLISTELASVSMNHAKELASPKPAFELPSPPPTTDDPLAHREDTARREREKEGDRDQMWKTKFDQLKEFHEQNGHCEVKGRKNKALSAWIRRQRYNLDSVR